MTFYIESTGIADLTSSKTIFFKYKSLATVNEYLIGSDGVDTKRGWALLILSDKVTFRNYYSATQFNELEVTNNVRDGEWHSIALTVNTTTNVYTLYIDGSSGSGTSQGTFTETHLVGTNVAVGLKHWRGNVIGLHVSSSIDSLRIYSDTKTATWVGNIHNFEPEDSEIPITEKFNDGLLAHNTFGSTETAVITDFTSTELSSIDDLSIIRDALELPEPVNTELDDINIENLPTLDLEPIKINLNDIGITNIPTITVPDSFTISATSIEDLSTLSIPDIDISTIDSEKIDIREIVIPDIDKVTKPSIITPVIDIDDDDDDTSITTRVKQTPTVTSTRDQVKYFKAFSSGKLLIRTGASGQWDFGQPYDSKFISFWVNNRQSQGDGFPDIKISGIVPSAPDLDQRIASFGGVSAKLYIKPRILTSQRASTATPANSQIHLIFSRWGTAISTSLRWKSRIALGGKQYFGTTGRRLQQRRAIGHPSLITPRCVLFLPHTKTLNFNNSPAWSHVAILFNQHGITTYQDGTINSTTPTIYPKGTRLSRELVRDGCRAVGASPSLPYTENYRIQSISDHRNNGQRIFQNFKQTYDVIKDIDIPTATGPPKDSLDPFGKPRGSTGIPFQLNANSPHLTELPELRYLFLAGNSPSLLDPMSGFANDRLLKTVADYRQAFNRVIVDHAPRGITPSEITLEIGSSNNTSISDIRVYDGSKWSMSFLQGLTRQ